MQRRQRLSLLHKIAQTDIHHKTHRRIDGIGLFLPARAEILRAVADLRRIHIRDIAVRRCGNLNVILRLRQKIHVVANARVAALRRNHRLQLRQTRAAFQRIAHASLAVLHVLCDARRDEHAAAQLQRHGQQIAAHASGKHINGFLDLQRVADMRTQRLLHAGDQRQNGLARLRADIHHRLRQRNRLIQRLHQGAASRLDVQHDGTRAAGELFGYDARRDERHAANRARYVAQRIQRLVRRAEVMRLSDDSAADVLNLLDELLLRLLD